MAEGFRPTPATEDLSSFLQDVPDGAHVAVLLDGLDARAAGRVAREAARERGLAVVPVGDRSEGALPTLADALAGGRVPDRALVLVDAQGSIGRGGAEAHARAEAAAGREPSGAVLILCLYTLQARRWLGPAEVARLHRHVVEPGAVPPA